MKVVTCNSWMKQLAQKNTDHSFSYLLHYLKSPGKVPTWVQIMDNVGSTNKKSIHAGCYIGSPAANILDYFRISLTVAGHTIFAPDQLFYLTARDVYASDVFNERELSAVMQQNASVVFDSGCIMCSWRDTVTKKYNNLPGLWGLHDFSTPQNPGANALIKVRDNCYTGTQRDTPMKVAKGTSQTDSVLPGVGQSYYALGMVKELSDTNFIPHDRWHKLATN